MTSIVSLDLETTGLDPKTDAITEIGAVRFNSRRVEEEFSTLVNPLRSIPPFITKLTGITNAMVKNAPTLEEVIPDLVDFVQDLPILGHNVKFDIGFLREAGIFKYNDTLDTYPMAAALMPSAGRYNLGALGQQLNILLPATHRALDDAKVTHAVYLRLVEKAHDLPLEILAEIVRLGEQTEWGAEYVFQEAMKQRSKEAVTGKRTGPPMHGPLYTNPPPQDQEPLAPNPHLVELDIEEVSALLERGGEFSRYFEHFEHRPQQVELTQIIAQALSEGRHLLAEAGTGTGKSMAYLVPSAIWAMQNNTRVVISTNTINLQDQLVNKDIPDVKAVIGDGLEAVVLKGRSNYLCPRRLEAMRRKGPENPDEIRILAKMLVWLGESEFGDLSEINLTGPTERAIWGRISANDEGCTTETCIRRMGGICPFHRARKAAQHAHILVVNHALLLADVATGSRVLPEYEYLIVDEAHHIENATTSALSFRVTQNDVERTIKEIGGPNAGLLGRMLGMSKDLLDPGQIAALTQLAEKTTDKAYQFQNLIRNFFITINKFLEDQREGRPMGTYAHQERILPSTRTLPPWFAVETAWEETNLALAPLMDNLEQVGQAIGDLMESGEEELEDLATNLNNVYRRLGEYDMNLNGLVFEPSDMQIYWVEINPQRKRITLEAAPLHIGELMEKHIWMEKTSVTLTSATMTTNGDFDYIRRRLNAFDAEELFLGSPYDYESSTLLYIPDNIPEPSDRNGHQKAVNQGLINLSIATSGRTLALFTSYAQLKTTAQAIRGRLADQGITIFQQGEGASPHALLESFKNSEQALLLGTRSFWEGVDIPGDDLSALAIIKLPFSVPSDPIVAARSETFESPFFEYNIPEAILAFRQGFGRLIRTKNDRGIVVVFDKRVLTKQYGKMFIDSLPPATVKTGPLEDIGKEAQDWLGI